MSIIIFSTQHFEAYFLFSSHTLIGLLLAINRFCAVAIPTKYNAIFNRRFVIKIVIGSWILMLIVCALYHIDGCHYNFDRITYRWQFEDTLCGRILGEYAEYYFSLFVILMSLIINGITLVKFLAFKKVCMHV
ncbi:unnamed protein product [Toxocara canis]|uniref:G-protein coupled receptors family 1 profile domain-containing protein n=1 Tax=Toxocara canis TaxID=6265 RepID=A0A3P7F658_TOXCA|nr:unnamed protein product [Toxocara canis]